MRARGIAFGAIGVLFLAAGLVFRWLEVAHLGTVLVVLVVAALRVVVRRPEVTVERSTAPRRVARTNEALVAFEIESRTGSPAFELYQPFGSAGSGPRVFVRRIARRGRVIESRPLDTGKRGVHVLPPVEVRRSDPFGFVEVTKRLCATDALVVTPRIVPLRLIDLGSSRAFDSPVAVAFAQGSMVFDRIREYVPGDDVRHIDWRATARTDEPMVRQFVDTTLPVSVVVFDDDPSSYPEGDDFEAAFDEAIDVTASVIGAARSSMLPAELWLASGHVIEPAEGTADPQFDALTTLVPSPGADLHRVVLGLRATAGGANLVIVGGRVEPALIDAASMLARRFDRVVVCHVHPAAAPTLLPAPRGVTALSVPALDELPRLWAVAVTR